jgi:hypothetical protein
LIGCILSLSFITSLIPIKSKSIRLATVQKSRPIKQTQFLKIADIAARGKSVEKE